MPQRGLRSSSTCNAGLVSAEVEDALVWAISRTAGGPGGHP